MEHYAILLDGVVMGFCEDEPKAKRLAAAFGHGTTYERREGGIPTDADKAARSMVPDQRERYRAYQVRVSERVRVESGTHEAVGGDAA